MGFWAKFAAAWTGLPPGDQVAIVIVVVAVALVIYQTRLMTLQTHLMKRQPWSWRASTRSSNSS
jgi:hypothetical protein